MTVAPTVERALGLDLPMLVVAETQDPSLTVYGVSFVTLAPTLQQRIDQTIAAHLERDLETSSR